MFNNNAQSMSSTVKEDVDVYIHMGEETKLNEDPEI